MGLREVLAELDVQVRGLGSVEAAGEELDRYVAATSPAITKFEQLRVKQGEASEVARRLVRQIRKLQKAEGDHSREITQLRVAYVRVKEASRQYGVEADKARVTQGQTSESAGKLSGKLGKVGVAAAGVAIAMAVAQRALSATIDLFTEMIDLGDALERTSSGLGVSSDALQEWRFVAQRSNVSAGDLDSAIGALSEKARSGRGPWAELGIAIRDSAGELRPTEELFEETILSLGRIENATTRARVAQQVFGSSSESLTQLIDSGSASIEELRERFAELGGGLSEDVVEGSRDAENAMEDFRLAVLGVKNTLVVDFLPTIGRIITETATLVAEMGRFIRTSSIVEAVIGTLVAAGIILAITFSEFLIPIILVIAAIALLVLIVEDVVTAFRGGESVFGGWVESFFEMLGVTTTFAGALDLLGIAWQEFKASTLRAISDILDGIQLMQDALGLQLFEGLTETAVSLRSAGAVAEREGRLQRKTRLAEEVFRRQDRLAVIQERQAGGDTNLNAEITVNGANDPEATARAVRRELTAAMRGAADGEALAEPT